jgi:hypothetical protein
MLFLFLLSTNALAEPAAIRAPVGGARLTAEVGGGGSLAAWRADGLGLAADVSSGGAAVGLSVGWRHLHPDGVGLDLFFCGGILVPLVEPGVAISGGASARVGYRRGHFDGGLGLTVPVALGVAGGGSGVAFRVPLLVEPAVGVRLGPVWLGGTGSMGPLWVTGSLPGIEVGGRISLAWEPSKPIERRSSSPEP